MSAVAVPTHRCWHEILPKTQIWLDKVLQCMLIFLLKWHSELIWWTSWICKFSRFQNLIFWRPWSVCGALSHFFPECVARVPVSLWRSGGCGCVRSTPRLCPQPFATVRNRSQPFPCGPHGRAYRKFCQRGHFWMFPALRGCVSCGRRGFSWHSDVFCNVWKVVLCGRRNTFATFSDDALQFSWQAHSTLYT